MSAIEYNHLLFEISRRLDELNVLDCLLFMCREMLASVSEDNIRDVLSLFKELEEQNNLGKDHLEVMKVILKSFKEWSFLGKVEVFESKRKKYNGLLEQIIRALDELNDVERLIATCRGKISQESEGHIQDVRSLFRELENQNKLGYHRLDILKGILIETEKNDLLKEVEEFEERRNQEDELKRKEDQFERWTAQAVAVASSVGNKLIGALNIKTIFKAVTVFSTVELLSGWPSYNQLVTAVNTCVLPAGTSLVNLTDGCVCLTVQAETLSALTTLWNLYQDGTLERRLYDLFVTDEVKERAGGETVEVNVTIEEQEYDEARLELINEAQEAASIGDGKRIRRNSDSDVYFRPKEEVPLSKLKHAEAELKFHKERIAVIRREITEQLSPEILEACGPEEKASFLKHREIWKGREVGEMNQKTDDPEMSQRPKAKLMDPGKFVFVQMYLEDVQDTRSMTTEASDSGLATHTAASELGTEEINETEKLCLKDLSRDVMEQLNRRLQVDWSAMNKFDQFFGLKMGDRGTSAGLGFADVKELFPDTTVSMLKECFEALRLYDLAEILEKLRPRSLRPALSPEQIEKLRRTDDRPTKYHSNVAVLVVNHSVKGDIVERDDAKKIETFFKDLNSRNEVAIISLASSQETREVLWEMEDVKQRERFLLELEESIRKQLEATLQEKARLEKELEEVMQIENGRERKMEKWRELRERRLRKNLSSVKRQELMFRSEMENAAKVKELVDRKIEKFKGLKKENEKALSTAMDEWIHCQEKFTCVAVFIISDDEFYTKAMLEECVVEKLALIPDHAKLVVSPSEFESVAKVPETLHVVYPDHTILPAFFTRMIEIFNKRWETLDLVSMVRELRRTLVFTLGYSWRPFPGAYISIEDSLSTLPTFQRKEDEHYF